MVKRGTRLLEGVNVAITKIDQVSTPQPTISDKDAADLCQKVRYLIDQIETLNAKDFATQTTLASILSQLDMTLSALRDALRGANNKDLSTLEADVESIDAKVATESTLSSIDAKVATESTLSSIDSKVATETTLSSVLARLDITLSSLRDAILAEEHVYSQLVDANETSAQSITLDTKGHKMLEVYASATSPTTFTLEVSHDGSNWIPFYTSPSPETTYGGDQTLWNGYKYARLSSAAAGSSGDKVSLYLGAK